MHKLNTYLADREKAKTCLPRIYEIGNKFNPNKCTILKYMQNDRLIETLFDIKQTPIFTKTTFTLYNVSYSATYYII